MLHSSTSEYENQQYLNIDLQTRERAQLAHLYVLNCNMQKEQVLMRNIQGQVLQAAEQSGR